MSMSTAELKRRIETKAKQTTYECPYSIEFTKLFKKANLSRLEQKISSLNLEQMIDECARKHAFSKMDKYMFKYQLFEWETINPPQGLTNEFLNTLHDQIHDVLGLTDFEITCEVKKVGPCYGDDYDSYYLTLYLVETLVGTRPKYVK